MKKLFKIILMQILVIMFLPIIVNAETISDVKVNSMSVGNGLVTYSNEDDAKYEITGVKYYQDDLSNEFNGSEYLDGHFYYNKVSIKALPGNVFSNDCSVYDTVNEVLKRTSKFVRIDDENGYILEKIFEFSDKAFDNLNFEATGVKIKPIPGTKPEKLLYEINTDNYNLVLEWYDENDNKLTSEDTFELNKNYYLDATFKAKDNKFYIGDFTELGDYINYNVMAILAYTGNDEFEEAASNANFILGFNLTYQVQDIIEGVNQIIKDSDATFLIDTVANKVDTILVDGKEVAKKYFDTEIVNGKLKVKINKEFIKTLPNGKHLIKIIYDDFNYSETSFSVLNITNPKTGSVIMQNFFMVLFGLAVTITFANILINNNRKKKINFN